MKFPFNKKRRRRVSRRPRRMGGRQVTTRSGRVLRVNTSLNGRWSEHREAKARRKVERMRGLPKSRVKRLIWRLNPRRMAEYWFSRDGALTALKFIGIAIFVFFVLTIGIFAFFRRDLNRIEDISNNKLGGSLTFYDRTGTIFLGQDYDKVKRVPVQSNQMSHWIKEATVAVEDRDFYSHSGFDIKGITRAAFNDLLHHGSVQGGSTITQQLVKLSEPWSQKRTVAAKIKELILAVQLERSFTKDKILSTYLNLAPYGSLDYGVQVAAQDYFHVDAKDISLPQAAFLAAIPKSPSVYSPFNKLYFDKKALLDRYNYVLDSMADTGKITKAVAEKYKKLNILAKVHKQQSKFAGIIAPYFLQAAENEIESRWGDKSPNATKDQNTKAWKIVTTLDMNLQRLAEKKTKDNIPNLRAHLADESASVIEDVQTGQYLALVGGLDFNAKGYGQINFAQWPISPGSSFKPYDYSALIENRNDAGAGSVLYDIRSPLPQLGYPCTSHASQQAGGNCLNDFDFRSPGPETLRYAIGGSRNIPAVKAMGSVIPGNIQASVDKTIATAERLMNNGGSYACYKPGSDVTKQQKTDRTKCFTSSAIGDGAYLHLDHHLNGLSSLGRMGLSIPATYILKIYDSPDSKKPFYEWTQPNKGDTGVDQVVRPETAYIVNHMLSDPNASYFGYGTKFQSYNGWRIAVKTGTTNNAADGLMMAYTTKYAVGSWIGYHTRTQAVIPPMENITMPLTRDIIQGALDMSKAKPSNWNEPSGIQHLPAFLSRMPFSSQGPAVSTDIFPSWFKGPSGSTKIQTIDKVSNKVATHCTPAAAKQTTAGGTSALRYSIDAFYPPGHATGVSTSASNDDVHSCSDSQPIITLTIAKVSNGKYTIAGTATAGSHPLNDSKYPQFPGTITLSIGGNTVKSCGSITEGVPCSYTYKPSASGKQGVSAHVMDSVLYENSDGASYNFQAVSNLSFVSAHYTNPTTITATWSGGSGTHTVTPQGSSTEICHASNGTSCSGTAPLGVPSVTITDSSSSVSGSVN